MTGMDRPPVFTEDGLRHYRASFYGSCPRAVVLAARGTPRDPSPFLDRKAEQGKALEPVGLNHARSLGWTILDAQREVSLCAGFAVLSGHIDALAWNDDHDRMCLLEVKSASPARFDAWLRDGWSAFPAYAWQTSFYAHMVRATEVMMVWVENMGQGVPGRTHVTFTEPPRSLPEIVARILDLERLVAADETCAELPPCPAVTPFCPYASLHDKEPEEEEFEWTGNAEVLSEYCSLSREIRQLQLRRDGLRDHVMAGMEGKKRACSGAFRLVRYEVRHLDAAAVRSSNPGLYARCLKAATALRVTLWNQEEA